MKSLTGRVLRKLKFISTLGTLKQDHVFQANLPNQNLQFSAVNGSGESDNLLEAVNGKINACELEKDVEKEESVSRSCVDQEEEFRVPIRDKEKGEILEYGDDHVSTTPLTDQVQLLAESQVGEVITDPSSKIGISSDIQQECASLENTSDSKLESLFKLTSMEDCSRIQTKEKSQESSSEALQGFEEKCPPGGDESVVFYSTSVRGIRKTFEDCNQIRFLLESLQVLYDERDISMHLEYREELWRVLEAKVVPPKLFIKGRYIGGADEVVGLHEEGILRKLLQEMPLKKLNGLCNGCGGAKFVLCHTCNGSHKVIAEGQSAEFPIRCAECNENGLIKCPICSS